VKKPPVWLISYRQGHENHYAAGMSEKTQNPQPLLQPINRQQMCWRAVDVERLIGLDHPARAIWELTGRLDLRAFYEGIGSSAEEGGRPAIDPRLLISLWVYAYSLGIGSAREVERRCEHDPAFEWLTGLTPVNYHTLADFRVQRGKELEELFTDLLGVLSAEGLITLQEVMQDGTKIQARASGKTFHREKTLREHLERARQQVEALRDPLAEPPGNRRQQAARERAAREKQARLEQALEELAKLREQKKTVEEKRQARASTSDPGARVMKQSNGGFAPSYNAQISTDSKHGLIVAVEASQAGNDFQQLVPAAERIEARWGRKPGRMVADAGYTSAENIRELAERGIEFFGSLADDAAKARTEAQRFPATRFEYQAEEDCFRCPAGQTLLYQGRHERGGMVHYKYQAAAEDCASCALRACCCGGNQTHGRSVERKEETPVLAAFREKMARAEAQQVYRRRGPIAEFVHAWIKSKLGLRQFHVRGWSKVRTELLWACFTYNLQQWIRLSRTPALALAG
jgi:transposase